MFFETLLKSGTQNKHSGTCRYVLFKIVMFLRFSTIQIHENWNFESLVKTILIFVFCPKKRSYSITLKSNKRFHTFHNVFILDWWWELNILLCLLWIAQKIDEIGKHRKYLWKLWNTNNFSQMTANTLLSIFTTSDNIQLFRTTSII